MDYEALTLYGVAPAKELYKNERRSITEAVDFSVRFLPYLRRNAETTTLSLRPSSLFPVLASKLTTLGTDTPLITTWHEVWLDYWDEYLGRLAPFGKGVERLTAKMPHHPIAISSVTANRLTEIVPNGIDVKQIETTRPAEDGFDVLYAGRLIEHKNVDLLLEAFDRVAETDPDITLSLIDNGPERDALERQAQTLDLADRVTMLGFLEEYNDAHMRASDISETCRAPAGPM